MFDWEHDKKKDWERSEALWHFRERYNRPEEKVPDHYEPHWSEEEGETKPREVWHGSNSYEDVSLAVNRRRELTLTVSEKRRHNHETLDSEHKQLKGKRRRTVAGPVGWAFTNSVNPKESAFAFKTRKIEPARRVIQQIRRYVDSRGQDTVERVLPFLHLDQDRQLLQRLRSDTGGVREEVQDLTGLDRAKERLAREVMHKEQMQRQFMKKFQRSITKARQLAEAGEPAWFQRLVKTEELAATGTVPGGEEGEAAAGWNEPEPEESAVEKKT